MTNNTAAAIAAEIIATTETRIELRAASGWCLFAVPSDEGPELTDVLAYRRYSDDYPYYAAPSASAQSAARDQLEGRVPEETLDAFERFYLENEIAWAQVQ